MIPQRDDDRNPKNKMRKGIIVRSLWWFVWFRLRLRWIEKRTWDEEEEGQKKKTSRARRHYSLLRRFVRNESNLLDGSTKKCTQLLCYSLALAAVACFRVLRQLFLLIVIALHTRFHAALFILRSLHLTSLNGLKMASRGVVGTAEKWLTRAWRS